MGTGVTLTVYSPANLLALMFSLMSAGTWVGAWQEVSPAVGAGKTGWLKRYIQQTGAIQNLRCAISHNEIDWDQLLTYYLLL
jgi:hypothetical protein